MRAARTVAIEAEVAAELTETCGPAALGGVAIIDQQNRPVPADEATHPSVGKPAPDVTLTLLDDSTVRLASSKCEVVVLEFRATW